MNLTPLGIIPLIASGPFLLALIFTWSHYLKTRYQHALLFLLFWSSLFLWNLLLGLSELFLSIELKTLGILIIIPAGYSLVILLDMISRNNIEPIKIGAITFISIILIITSQLSDAQRIGPRGGVELSIITSGRFSVVVGIFSMFIGTLFLSYMIRIKYHAPKSMKKISNVNLIGAFIMGGLTPLLYFLGVSKYYPGVLDFFFSSGSLVCALCFIKNPQLAYILPFKTTRLMIIDTISGISLFNYSWSKSTDFFQEAIFAGGINVLSTIFNVTLSSGAISEIILEKGVFLIKHIPAKKISCILVTSQSSRFLQQALDKFVIKLTQNSLSGGIDVQSINKEELLLLVMDNFAFLPQLD